jgi:phosphatidylserine/phosphatidylglycerophosphate/cardiolipin synthase-like enzyme
VLKSDPFLNLIIRCVNAMRCRLATLGDFSSGNEIKIYAIGDNAFRSIWHEIRHAKRSVYVETYTLDDDAVGQRTVDLLTEATLRGVKVTLVYDQIGSPDTMWSSLTSKLIAAGGSVVAFNPVFRWPWFIRNPFLRNHRL